ncbi:hypothetical protein E7T06_10460 [Deinococcus sp. Arct2-2]|uniref:hypothetical protein n=1 Tax=Deinococcus sp. Arct2-2 TaxID=2568653 RepID=UPI0010A2B0B7|nr:hypothetical protein [Deinococcus sp. Arct2-2]THF69792.1 hypothetical protein E7T06_10460 [Deinococcus sp. Arct2-2]
MTAPAPVPQGFPDAPLPAQLLQDARTGLERRASRLMTALGLLAVLSGLGVLALVLLVNLGWQAFQRFVALPDLQAQFNLPAGQTVADLIPGWALPTLLALSVMGTAIQMWASLRARAAIGAVRDQTLNPSADHAEALIGAARTVRPWITLGQWTPIIWTVFSLAWLPITFAVIGRIDPEVQGAVGIDAFSIAFALVSIVIQSLPGIILTWLILAAVRRWLDAVLARAQGGTAPVTPVSRPVEGWLLFVLIVLIVSTVSLVISAVPMLVLPALFSTLAASEPEFSDLASVGLTPANLQMFFSVLAGLLVFSGLVYGLLTAMMAWSRGLAANVATILDAPLPRPPAAMNDWTAVPDTQDLWKGPVTVVPPRN